MEWWNKRVFYQIYPRSFCDANNDGMGDIRGVISKLPYLKDLGIGAIWLSPVTASSDYDNGYDVSDYCDINPKFGTMDDFQALLKEADKLDIKIIMDLVINHTSDQHRWFIESKNPESPYHNYYVWKEPRLVKGKKLPPNNWDSLFLGSAWKYCEENGLYYLHLFTENQPDLNYNNPQVIEEVKKILKFWLDMGVAGFRCDVINCIYKTSYEDAKKRIIKTGKEFYLSQKGCHDILKELNREVLKPYNAFTVGETMDVSLEEAKDFIQDELTLVFPFEHHTGVDCRFQIPVFKRKYKPFRMIRILKKWQTKMPWTPLFFENHDQARSVSRFGDEGRYYKESVKMLATVLLTQKGMPFIYQGQEIGLPNTDFKSMDEIDDIATKNIYNMLKSLKFGKKRAFRLAMNFARDHARTPIPWDDSENGGFCTVKPWLRLNERYKEINVKKNLSEPDSCFSYYKRLIALRNSEEALQFGDIEFVDLGKDVFAYYRKKDDKTFFIVSNMSGKAQKIREEVRGLPILFNYRNFNPQQKILRPFESVITRI
ncbi:alpha-glucosidase [Treponema sp. OMZ 799]|uniref:alpha-glucosidase n=1 Tax=Treponema sp. OMZ 799 TaxID=2563668 RepID=UPI0020A28D7C|nr:alpha-amylase family glycosyl hydrolase [Treponema sp. OMZ 799]UTC76606.1 alpha-glucosidase [Treponema sp. OMZ 799]